MTQPGFDRGAAVTRSLLGWGVVAGPWYLVIGVVLALTRPGFGLTEHALSLLTLGENGWIQRVNLVLTGLMVLAAAAGVLRAIHRGRGLAIPALTGVFGVGVVLSAVFPPDPVDGFPPGATAAVSTSGILHLLVGGLGFVALAAAAAAYARWARSEPGVGGATWAIALAVFVVVGFAGGAALADRPAGLALLWVAVLAGWSWLALTSVRLYRWTPHPDTAVRY